MKTLLLLSATIATSIAATGVDVAASPGGRFVSAPSGVASFAFANSPDSRFVANAQPDGFLGFVTYDSVDDPDGNDCSVTSGQTTSCTATNGDAECSVWANLGSNQFCSVESTGSASAKCSAGAVSGASCSVGSAYSGRTDAGKCSARGHAGSSTIKCSAAAVEQKCSSDAVGFCSAGSTESNTDPNCSVSASAQDSECSATGDGHCSVQGSNSGASCSVVDGANANRCTSLSDEGSPCSVDAGSSGACSTLNSDGSIKAGKDANGICSG